MLCLAMQVDIVLGLGVRGSRLGHPEIFSDSMVLGGLYIIEVLRVLVAICQ